MGIDIWEVIAAAATKPFGFHPFYPGPGLGGHCIPVDPFYLSWKAKEYDFSTRFIELAGEINMSMPYHMVDFIAEALNARCKALKGAKVLVLGISYRRISTIFGNRLRSQSSKPCRDEAQSSTTTILISQRSGKGVNMTSKCTVFPLIT